MAFQACPQCGRMVGVREGKIATHYPIGGIVPPLLDDPTRPIFLTKSKERCGSSGKPFFQSTLTAYEKDILGPTTFD